MEKTNVKTSWQGWVLTLSIMGLIASALTTPLSFEKAEEVVFDSTTTSMMCHKKELFLAREYKGQKHKGAAVDGSCSFAKELGYI